MVSASPTPRPALVISILFALAAPVAGQGTDPLEFVDPLIGTGNGNCVPGAQVPFGFVTASPDTLMPRTSGYNYAMPITGFSQIHVSGTGGAGKYGNFLVTPQCGEPRILDRASTWTEEVARPGYYAVTLGRDGIRVEMTASRMVAYHRYTFPKNRPATILLDASSVLTPGKWRPTNQKPVLCDVRVIPPNRIEGGGRFTGGWNPGPYTMFFSAEFDRPFADSGTWTSPTLARGSRAARGDLVGAYAAFAPGATGAIQMKIGVSFAGPAEARRHLRREIPAWDFDAARARARSLWRNAISRIEVTGGTSVTRTIFHTALYHVHTMPHDVTGDGDQWPRSVPHYEDFYCLWDTFRTLHPLFTVIQPGRQRDMIRSLLHVYERTGWMPDAFIAGSNGMTQGGSHSDALVADAAVKGLGAIDYARAYRAMLRNAEEDSPRPDHEGRVVGEYRRLGYIPLTTERSVSRTMDYAFNDFCVARVAGFLGRESDRKKYLARSGNWANLWNPAIRAVCPRRSDGSWLAPFRATDGFGTWKDHFYEGTAWQYSTFVPHEPQGLINRLGGNAEFLRWLDEFFDGGHYNPGNEPDILAPYLYIHAGRPDRTAERVRDLLGKYYGTDRNWLPGDDDSGTMSAWYVWGAIGLYPNTGQDFYYITSPLFESSVIHLSPGKAFRIEAPGTSAGAKYIRSATLNGKPLHRAFLRHSDIARGGTLALEMGTEAAGWAASQLPPSVSTPESGSAGR